MKIAFKLLCVILILSLTHSAFAQFDTNYSRIKPQEVYWTVKINKITLKQGFDEGIDKPKVLDLVMVLDKNTLTDIKMEDVSFEFQWYRWGPTKKYLKKSSTEKIYQDGDKLCIKSSAENLSNGWWEVNVICYFDSGFMKFKEKIQYQILIR